MIRQEYIKYANKTYTGSDRSTLRINFYETSEFRKSYSYERAFGELYNDSGTSFINVYSKITTNVSVFFTT